MTKLGFKKTEVGRLTPTEFSELFKAYQKDYNDMAEMQMNGSIFKIGDDENKKTKDGNALYW